MSCTASAATITAVQNGNWTAASTWDAARVPQGNDEVVVPASLTVSFSGSPYPKNTPTVRPTLNIRILGTLDFSAVGNDKLYLGAGSTIQIFPGGKIQTNTSSSEIIAIYNGGSDNTVWTGTPATINGPASATATSSGFLNSLLPLTLESFTINKDNKGFATLTWITSAEVNTLRFEIERIITGSSIWQVAGNVNASGYSSISREYDFVVALVAGENQFRLKQIDIDGKFTYSPVVSVRYITENNIAINYDQRTRQISLKGLENDHGKLYITNASGHTVFTGSISSPLIFQPPSSGIYFVNLVNNHLRVAKKIMVY
jgi:hypothetical protein